MRQMKEKRMLIKAQEVKAKERVDRVAAQKWAQVRMQKDHVIK